MLIPVRRSRARDAASEKNTPTGVETRMATSMDIAAVGRATAAGIQSGSVTNRTTTALQSQVTETQPRIRKTCPAAAWHS